jgi:hypothetical protein
VESREAEFQAAFVEVFGVSPRIRCVARDPGPDPVVLDDDEAPRHRRGRHRRLKAELGAEPEA